MTIKKGIYLKTIIPILNINLNLPLHRRMDLKEEINFTGKINHHRAISVLIDLVKMLVVILHITNTRSQYLHHLRLHNRHHHQHRLNMWNLCSWRESLKLSNNQNVISIIKMIKTNMMVRILKGRILEEVISRRLIYCNLIEKFIVTAKAGAIVAMKVGIIIKAKRKIIFQSHHHFLPPVNQILVSA